MDTASEPTIVTAPFPVIKSLFPLLASWERPKKVWKLLLLPLPPSFSFRRNRGRQETTSSCKNLPGGRRRTSRSLHTQRERRRGLIFVASLMTGNFSPSGQNLDCRKVMILFLKNGGEMPVCQYLASHYPFLLLRSPDGRDQRRDFPFSSRK